MKSVRTRFNEFNQFMTNANEYKLIDSKHPSVKVLQKFHDGFFFNIVVVDNNRDIVLTPHNLECIVQDVSFLYNIYNHNPSKTMVLLMQRRTKKLKSFCGKNIVIMNNVKASIHKTSLDDCFREEISLIGDFIEKENLIQNKLQIEAYVEKAHSPWMVYLLFGANLFMFLFYFGRDSISFFGISINSVVNNGEYYRLFTYMFTHGGFFHLIGNMITLLAVGSLIERELGAKKTLILYVIGGIYAGAFSLFISFLFNATVTTVGASGSIFAFLAAYMVMRLVDKNSCKGTKRVVATMLFLLISGFFNSKIDVYAHIGGFLGGIFIYAIFFLSTKRRQLNKLTKIIARLRMKKLGDII